MPQLAAPQSLYTSVGIIINIVLDVGAGEQHSLTAMRTRTRILLQLLGLLLEHRCAWAYRHKDKVDDIEGCPHRQLGEESRLELPSDLRSNLRTENRGVVRL